jgi:hypothetical protein
MRSPALFLSLLLSATPLAAETISQEIGRSGLAATEARLAALPAPAPDEAFALGGVRFLRAIETSFQIRWRNGLTDRTGMLPFLRLPLTDNLSPQPFDPGAIAAVFQAANGHLAGGLSALQSIDPAQDFGLTIDLSDLWFDVDADGTRTPGEGLLEIAAPMIPGSGLATDAAAPVIRFDRADAAWLTAYSHLLSALSEVVLAYDPTEPVTRVMAAVAGMQALAPLQSDWLLGGSGKLQAVDMLAMLIATLDQTPDAARMAAAHEHLLQVVAQNRRFWDLVAQETDNEAEWLPNDAQVSGLGVALPPGTSARWQAVLAEAEAILQGRALIPYWRLGEEAGLNVQKIFLEPRPVDLAGWIQGWAALPYLQQGPLASPEAVRAFDEMAGGQAMLLAFWLN